MLVVARATLSRTWSPVFPIISRVRRFPSRDQIVVHVGGASESSM